MDRETTPMQSPSASGINVIPAFKWSSTGYRSELSTIFPNVMDFRVAPFHGMTDLLLIGEGSSKSRMPPASSAQLKSG